MRTVKACPFWSWKLKKLSAEGGKGGLVSPKDLVRRPSHLRAGVVTAQGCGDIKD
jgi:hypothetical protein